VGSGGAPEQEVIGEMTDHARSMRGTGATAMMSRWNETLMTSGISLCRAQSG
jgi:hypothetical protein